MTYSYGQVIADGGFADDEGLIELVRAWLTLFDLVKPAAVYCEHAPASVLAAHVARLPNTSLFAVPGLKAETAIISFDLNGIAVSSGAACSSGKVQISSVLTAMGVEGDLARGAMSLAISWLREGFAGKV